MHEGHRGVLVTAAVAVAAIVVLRVVGYRLNQAERQKAEQERQSALAAHAEAERARQEAKESSASLGRVSGQAAAEFIAKAARALDAQKWDEAREAAGTALNLAPELGVAWFEKGRSTMQTADFATTADCFARALDDGELDEKLRGRAGRLLLSVRGYARQQRFQDKLSMPQNVWLGQSLRAEGEGALAAISRTIFIFLLRVPPGRRRGQIHEVSSGAGRAVSKSGGPPRWQQREGRVYTGG